MAIAYSTRSGIMAYASGVPSTPALGMSVDASYIPYVNVNVNVYQWVTARS